MSLESKPHNPYALLCTANKRDRSSPSNITIAILYDEEYQEQNKTHTKYN